MTAAQSIVRSEVEFPKPESGLTLRLGELFGALSYALDVTEGQPEGHAVRCCWLGLEMAQEMGLDQDQQFDLYFTLLLKDLGCSANAASLSQLFGSDERKIKFDFKLVNGSHTQTLPFILKHAGGTGSFLDRLKSMFNVVANQETLKTGLIHTRCHRGAEIARLMRFSKDVAEGIQGLDEHWDGSGQPYGLKRRDIHLYARFALLTQVAEVYHAELGPAGAEMEVQKRSGKWFDPELVEVFQRCTAKPDFWDRFEAKDLPSQVFSREPAHIELQMDDAYLDDIARAFAKVIDAKSPFTHGHSERVSYYTDLMCRVRGFDRATRRWMIRTSLLHDVGKLGVSNTVLDKPGKLTGLEYEQIKSHARMSYDILGRVDVFSAMSQVAATHHERLDGSGYPNGLRASELSEQMRILAVADVFDALSAERPYKPELPTDEVFAIMDEMAMAGLDADCYASLKSSIKQNGVFRDRQNKS